MRVSCRFRVVGNFKRSSCSTTVIHSLSVMTHLARLFHGDTFQGVADVRTERLGHLPKLVFFVKRIFQKIWNFSVRSFPCHQKRFWIDRGRQLWSKLVSKRWHDNPPSHAHKRRDEKILSDNCCIFTRAPITGRTNHELSRGWLRLGL